MSPTLRVTIDPRFRGPTQSGNGGYSCGLLAAVLGGSVEVTLRAPPPLATPLRLVRAGDDRARLEHGGRVIAETRRIHDQWPAPPDAPDLDTVRAGEPQYAGHHAHDYPQCFACGPARAPGDGLARRPRMLLGRLTAHFDGAVEAGDRCIVLGWRERIDGRKHHAGTALFDAQGRCLGQSRQTWIALRGDD